jgi:pilus assembly protein CpaF
VFAIIVSEKGGAERRESFDKNEITVGRVQGNDLTLPKGNVSKHHARLLFREGRFIVTDLKSTNGTYVNGRKIAQATVVREGDKIYIGDFVIRLEASAGAAAGPAVPEIPTAEAESEETQSRADQPVARPAPAPAANPPIATMKAPTHPPPAPAPRQPAVAPIPSTAGAAPAAVAPLPSPRLDATGEDVAAAPPKPRPSVPPIPLPSTGAGRSLTMPLNQMSPSPLGGARAGAPGFPAPAGPSPAVAPATPPQPIGAAPSPVNATPPIPVTAMTPPVPIAPVPLQGAAPQPVIAVQPQAAPPQRVAAPAPTFPSHVNAPAPVAAPPPAPAPAAIQPISAPVASVRGSVPPARAAVKETPAQAAHRLALTTLLDRVADVVELGPLRTSPSVPEALARQIEKAVQDGASAMRSEGDVPEGVDIDAVAREAQRELTGLGAFAPLLDDDDVLEIHCARFDQIVTRRSSVAETVTETLGFSSEDALYRVIGRLAQQSHEPWKPGETILERRIARGAFIAVAPPSAPHHVVSIRKRRRVESSLDELVRTSSLSRPMAQFLAACVSARANVLISGPAPLSIVSALSASGGNTERLAVVQDVEEIGAAGAQVTTLAPQDWGKGGEDCVRAAAKLSADHLVVNQLTGGVAAGTIDAMLAGTDGVIAATTAPTLRQGIGRLVAQVALYRPSLSLEGMREVIGEAFDIAIEVAVLPDHRLRVTRIAEFAGSDTKGVVARDLFTYVNDPAGAEGQFSATGVVPRIASDLAAQGVKLDPALFKRTAR